MINKKYEDFPVKLLTSDCFLKKIEYHADKNDKGKFECLKISFNKDNKWISQAFYNPIRSSFQKSEQYDIEKLRIALCLEHIASTYLTSEEMIDLYHHPKDRPGKFKAYCDRLIEILEGKKFRNIKVDIKTCLYNERAVLPRKPPFIRLCGDTRINFSYSPYEIEQINLHN